MKNFKSTLGLLMAAALIWACGPKGSTVETSEAKEVAKAASAETIKVNTEKSMVTWIGSKPAGKHNGTISISAGEISLKEGEVVAGNFEFDITALKVLDLPADSEWNAKLKGHLMSDDFFDAENFPKASFEITGVEKFNAGSLQADLDEPETEFSPASLDEIMVDSPTHIISGNLTMRGTTKNISFPAAVSLDGNQIKAIANFNIDRTEWGLKFKDRATLAEKVKDDFIYNTVNVGFELEAGTQSSL